MTTLSPTSTSMPEAIEAHPEPLGSRDFHDYVAADRAEICRPCSALVGFGARDLIPARAAGVIAHDDHGAGGRLRQEDDPGERSLNLGRWRRPRRTAAASTEKKSER